MPSLPYPASSVSCPELPKFPIELQKEPARKGPRRKGFRSVPSAVPENEAESDPEASYENQGLRVGLVAGASRPEGAQAVEEGFVNPAAVEDDDPQEEYYNQDAVNEIRAKGRIPNRSNTHSKNPAAVEDDDPQEEYYNQDAVNEIRAKGRIPNRSNTHSKNPASAEMYIDMQGGDGRERHGNLGDDDDQPVYGNEIADEPNGGNPYENIPFPPPKSS